LRTATFELKAENGSLNSAANEPTSSKFEGECGKPGLKRSSRPMTASTFKMKQRQKVVFRRLKAIISLVPNT
jgi:hypothetical protein